MPGEQRSIDEMNLVVARRRNIKGGENLNMRLVEFERLARQQNYVGLCGLDFREGDTRIAGIAPCDTRIIGIKRVGFAQIGLERKLTLTLSENVLAAADT